MRVLHITPTFAPSIGGIESVVGALVDSLIFAGIECDIAEVRTSNRQFTREQRGAGSVFRVPLYGNRLIGIAPELRKVTASYDLLHVHDPQLLCLSANAGLWGGGKPMVISTHGGFRHTGSYGILKRLHTRFTVRRMLCLYQIVLASSEADYNYFSKLTPRAQLARNGVNIEQFSAIRRHQSQGFYKWIYWGRLARNKRLDRVLEYLNFARQRGHNIQLTVCGSNREGILEKLLSYAKDHELGPYIDFVDTPSDPLLLTKIAENSVYVTGSEYEGFGLTVIEALSAGLPVICRNIDPLNRFITPGANGVLLSFDGSPEDFARLDDFISQVPSAHALLANKSKESAQQHSWQFAHVSFVRQYEKVLAGRDGRVSAQQTNAPGELARPTSVKAKRPKQSL